MNALGAALVWCVIQVTLFGLVGAAIYGIARRFGPQNGARAALACLLIVGVLGLAALSPWPSWVARSTGDNAVARTSANAGVNAADSTAVEPDSAKGKTSSTPNESKVKSPRGETNNGEPAPIGTNAKPAETEIVPTGEPAAGAESGVPPDADSAAPLTALLQSLWEELKRAPAPAAETSDQETETVGWSWRAWLAAVFLGGVAIGLIRMLAGLVAVRRHRQRSRPIEEPKLLETLDLLRAKLGCARPVALCESEALPTAATVGWRRPAILLPSAWRQWSPDQRGAVLAHELAHIGRNDFAAHLTAQLGVLLNFYHPLVHWLSGRLRLEQELAADAEAAELTGGRGAYLTTLAELALASPNIRLGWPAHTFLPTRGMFLRRIEMLRNTKGRAAAETKGRISRIARWASVAALLVAGVAAAGLRAPAGAELTGTDEPAALQAGEEEPQEKELVQKIRIPSDEGATDSPARAPKAHDDSTERSKTSTAIDVANSKSKVEFRLAESEPGEGLVESKVPGRDEKIYLHKEAAVTNKHIASAKAGIDNVGRPAILFTLTDEGARRMKEVTSKNLPDPATGGKKSLAILVEGKLISAPTINSTISNQGIIEGDFDAEEVKRLAMALGATLEQATFRKPSQSSFGKALGEAFEKLISSAPRNGKDREAALRAQSQNNLKRIALALHNYHDTHKHFPPAVLYGPDGKTPYSWRVAILPFLEGQGKQLYEAYHFDEPWDGPNNKKLLSQMPDVFRCPQDGPNSTNTSYFVLTGPETVFSGKKGTGFREITDGTSNTLAVVESVNFKYRSDRQTFRVKGEDSDRVVMRPVWTRVDVPWTKPVDIPYAADKSAPKLGGWYQGGFHVAMCDGSVRFFSDKIDENTLRSLITKVGAEMIRQDRMSPKPFDEIPEPKMDQELRELLKEQDFRDEPMDGIGPNFFEQEIPDLHQLDIDPKAPIDPDKFKINP